MKRIRVYNPSKLTTHCDALNRRSTLSFAKNPIKMKVRFYFLAALLFVQLKCASPTPAPTSLTSYLASFPIRPDWPETLHFFLADSLVGTPLSDTLLKAVLDSAQFESLHFGTGEARFSALGQFPLEEGFSAGVVQTEEFWFGKQSLLVFDIEKQKCLSVVELSHFYGGDGGQTASESWLFRGKSPLRLFVKTAEHGLTPPNDPADDLVEYLRESGQLFLWEAKQFRPVPNPDSLLFLEQFRMHQEW